jgi:hypothetical protein
LSTHAKHSQAVEGISPPGNTQVRERGRKYTLYALGVRDICERVTGTRIMKRTVIIKKRAMVPVSS